MPSKGKTKGNTGELKIAKFLTELYEAKFIRVPNSGAFLGGANANRRVNMDDVQISYFKSDLIPPSNMRKLVIESKFYADFPFHKLSIDEPIKQLDGWIKQILDTVDLGDLWFLVVRINRKGSFALFDSSHLSQFQITNHVRYQTYVWTDFEPFFARNKDVIATLTHTPS